MGRGQKLFFFWVGFEGLKTVTRLSHSNLLLTSTLFSSDVTSHDVMGRRLHRRLPLKAARPVESAPTAWTLGLDFLFTLQDLCSEVFVWPSRTPLHKRKQERRSALEVIADLFQRLLASYFLYYYLFFPSSDPPPASSRVDR